MNKFILTFLLVIASFSLIGQNYPKIETDSSGVEIVIMTIEQVQKIDNNLDLLNLLKKQGFECDSLNVSYIKVIDNMGKQISLLELNITNLKQQIFDKDSQITNLQKRLSNEEESNKLCELQKNKDIEIINTLNVEIKKQKLHKNIGFGVGIISIIGITLMYLGVL